MFLPRAPETLISIRKVPRWLRDSRREAIRDGIPLLMNEISDGLKNGDTLEMSVRGIRSLGSHSKTLLEEFQSVGILLDAGISIEEALKAVAVRINVADFDLLVACCNEKDRSRQDVISSLNKVSKTLLERNTTLGLMKKTEGEAVSAGAIVGCIPFVALFSMNMFFPAKTALLANTDAGQAVFCIALALVMLGIAWTCSLGRTSPGQMISDVRKIRSVMGLKMAMPLAFCIIPAVICIMASSSIIGLVNG
jgi:Flp pilus assembly protein TadB